MRKWQRRLATCFKVSESGCWEWTGARNSGGYGRLRSDYGELAHRAAYFTKYPDADTSLCVCHKCDNPSCINTDHHFLGTRSDNARDMHSKGRSRVLNQLSEDDRRKILEAFVAGVGFNGLCRLFNRSPKSIRKALAGYRVQRKRTKITADMRRKWHEMRKSGALVKEIAEQLNVDISIVSTELNRPTIELEPASE